MWGALLAATILFAGVFVWIVGHRGVFLLDQSILFDGAWRIVQGQLPYRDYVTAFPPVPFFLLAAFFRLVGVDFSAMVLAAAVLNAAATVLVVWIVRVLLPAQRLLSLAAGLLTAVWFQAPFGTLWLEQTAFFFDLLALALLVAAIDANPRRAPLLYGAAGALLGVAMLSKQNAGVEFVPVALGVAVVPRLPDLWKAARAAGAVSLGLLLAFSAFVAWLWQFSSLSGFWQSYVVLTGQIGADRIDWTTTALGMLTLLPTWPHSWVATAALSAALLKARASAIRVPALPTIAWIAFGLVLFQNLFPLHTDNELENSRPFLGLIYALSIGLLVETFRIDGARIRMRLAASAAVLVFGLAFAQGAFHSWKRTVQQFPLDASFTERLQVPGMSRVRWGEPTLANTTARRPTLGRREFEDLNAWLAAADANFFVFPDATMLYGIHGRISPQPWLYFSAGHSFLGKDLPKVDAAVVDALRRNGVRIVILERQSWLGNDRLLKYMPALQGWIHDEFEKVREFGIFEVWQARR